MKPELRYTAADSEKANQDWKATCGPHSIAAALGLTLKEVRPQIPKYKGWMSPTQMEQTLQNLKARFSLVKELKTDELCPGINRIQWEGPWLNDPNPIKAYFHTHWVAHFNGWVLCTAYEPALWIRTDEWRTHHCENPFHVTHHYIIKQQPSQDEKIFDEWRELFTKYRSYGKLEPDERTRFQELSRTLREKGLITYKPGDLETHA